MSKVKFNADEMMVMAMFEQPTRTETMRYIEEVVPFVEDDVEVFSLVAYSFAQSAFFSSNACGMPPQPTYRERISCSSAVAACRCSASSVCSTRMASTLALYFAFGPPAPRSSSVMRKFIGSCLGCAGSSVSASLSSGRLCFRRAWLTSAGVMGCCVSGSRASSAAARLMASVLFCTSAISCICSGGNSGLSKSSNSPPDSATE